MYVETGDILALIAGIMIVIFIAVMANPEYMSGLPTPLNSAGRTPEVIPTVQTRAPANTEPHAEVLVTTTNLLRSRNPYQIAYTDKPYSFPSYMMPSNMETFGASEIPQKTLEWVPFAYIEDSRGGLTEVFSVPYPVWMINTTVIARNHPQYAIFRMVLCYAEDGRIIDGEEILNRGTSYRIVQTSNTGVYMIISTENIDSFNIRLETPRHYYDAYSPS